MRTFTLLFGLLTAVVLRAQTPANELAERIRQVENHLLPAIVVDGETTFYNIADRMKQLNVHGMGVVVIKNGQIDWAKNYGLASVETNRPVDERTLFQAASVSKPVTAMALLHWVQKGKFDLDTDVNRYLKSWQIPENKFTKSRKVSLRQLLSHEAGMTVHGFRGYGSTEPVPSLKQVLNGQKPANSNPVVVDTLPGSMFRYSGGGYSIVQQAMTDHLGKPFPEIMRETLLSKAGMNNSTFVQPLPPRLQKLAATGYRENGEPVQGNWHTYPELAAAGLWTTPMDLARFVLEIQNALKGVSEKVISKKTAEMMVTNPGHDYGLGPMLISRDDSLVLVHGGSNEGYRCIYVSEIRTGNGAVIMTNSDNNFTLIYDLIRSISKAYNWYFYKPEQLKKVDLTERQLDDLSGKYSMPDYLFEVVKNQGKLFVYPKWDMPSMEILPTETGLFRGRDGRYDVEFIYDTTGKVKAAKMFGDTFEKVE